MLESIFFLKDTWLFIPKSLMSLPLSFHQAIIESKKENTVKLADKKKKDPTQRVSPIPGTAEVAFHKEA